MLRTHATSRALSPSSEIKTARTRQSFEYPFAIVYPREGILPIF